jgi:hypothetical protein
VSSRNIFVYKFTPYFEKIGLFGIIRERDVGFWRERKKGGRWRGGVKNDISEKLDGKDKRERGRCRGVGTGGLKCQCVRFFEASSSEPIHKEG